MIKFLRNRSVQKRLFLALAILIIPSFVIYGVVMKADPKGPGMIAGYVEKQKITTGDFIRHYEALRRQLTLFQGLDPSTQLDRMNLEEMVWDRILLLDEARRRRIKVSDQEVVDWLRAQDVLAPNGRLNPQIYQEFVQQRLRISPRQFEEDIRKMLTLNKLFETLDAHAPADETEAKQLYIDTFAPRDIKYVVLTFDQFRQEMATTEEEVQKIYDMVHESLRIPEQFKFNYVVLPAGAANAEDVRGALSAGLLSKASDFGLTVKTTEFLKAQDALPEIGFAEAAGGVFELQNTGDRSAWLDFDGGAVIFELVEKKAETVMPADEAKEKIRTRLAQNKQQEGLAKLTTEIKKEMDEKGFDEAAAARSLTVLEKTGYKAGDYLDKAGVSPMFDMMGGRLKTGEISDPVRTENGFALFVITARDTNYNDGWEEKKEEFIKETDNKKRYDAYQSEIEKLRARLRIDNKTMDALFPARNPPPQP